MPLSQHVEEMRYMGGEVCRLKERIALLERDLSVAHELKVRWWFQTSVH